VTFCWCSGWSFVLLPKPVYLVFVALFGVAGIGLARIIKSRKSEEGAFAEQREPLTAAVCLLLFFIIGVAYHKINAYGTVRFMGGPGGWYFYAIVAPISFIIALGLWKTWPKCARCMFLVVFGAVAILEVYAVLMVLAPYYTGIAVPAVSGWGVTFVESWVLIFSQETAALLTANTPRMLSPNVLLCLAAAYGFVLIAVFWNVVVASANSSPSARSPA